MLGLMPLPNPVLSSEEFESLVAAGVAALPAWVKEKMDNVVFLAEPCADEEVLRAEGLTDPLELFGYYRGVPLSERDHSYGNTLPDTITLYQLPHEARAHRTDGTLDRALLARLVAETVWHEVGHHLGLSEDQVAARERERGHEVL